MSKRHVGEIIMVLLARESVNMCELRLSQLFLPTVQKQKGEKYFMKGSPGLYHKKHGVGCLVRRYVFYSFCCRGSEFCYLGTVIADLLIKNKLAFILHGCEDRHTHMTIRSEGSFPEGWLPLFFQNSSAEFVVAP